MDDAGIVAAQRWDEDALFMDEWVAHGLHGNMSYFERNQAKRYDIRELVPGARTVVVTLLTYEHSGHDYHRLRCGSGKGRVRLWCGHLLHRQRHLYDRQ